MLNVYDETITREQALRSVRNAIFTKMIDVEINHNIAKSIDITPMMLDKTRLAEHNKKTDEMGDQVKKMQGYLNVIDEMLAETIKQ